MSFYDEIKGYTIDELELIINTQKDLYSEEEMEQIITLFEERVRIQEAKHKAKINSRLPKTIICPKCDGPNAFINDCCEFCGCKLDKSKYYTDEYYENSECEVITSTNDSYTFHYIFSFLIPLVGFIVGAIMLANDNQEKRSALKKSLFYLFPPLFH